MSEEAFHCVTVTVNARYHSTKKKLPNTPCNGV